jgi:hypothetical protein
MAMKRQLIVSFVARAHVRFTFDHHEYRGSIKGRHSCPTPRPIAVRDRLTIAHRQRNGDVLAIAVCGCPFFIFDVSPLPSASS